MRKVTTSASGIVITDTAASSGEIQNIMPMTPMIVSTEVSSWLSPCCSVVLRLSMSLVTRLRMSPCGWLSKYRSGSRASFSSTSRRSPYMVRWVTPAMMNPWPQPKAAPSRYTRAARARIRPSCVMSTPVPGVMFMPEIMSASWPWPCARSSATACSLVTPAGSCLPTTPSNRTLVAAPRIFGPVTRSATEVTPKTSTITSRTRSGRSRASSRRTVPRRSLLRSGGCPGPGRPIPAARIMPPPGRPIMPPPPRRAGTRRSPGRGRSPPSAPGGCPSRRRGPHRAR